MSCDVYNCDLLIIGAGPAGLAAAIEAAKTPSLRVCVLDKGAAAGAHVLSGALIDLSEVPSVVAPPPGAVPVRKASLAYLSARRAYACPMPANKHLRIVDLNAWCRTLAAQAEAAGVELFFGVAAQELLFDDAGTVIGVSADGVHFTASRVLLAEGSRGSLSEAAIARYDLPRYPTSYALGFKEVRRGGNLPSGTVRHTVGYPLSAGGYNRVRGGGFLYGADNNTVHAGLVVYLDYTDPSVDPFLEFQAWKRHRSVASALEGSVCVSYGARVIGVSGAVQQADFPGGTVIGCAAGTFDPLRRMGIVAAMRSGIAAARQMFDTGLQCRLRDVRNVHSLWQRYGLPGAALSRLDAALRSPFGLLSRRDDRKLDQYPSQPRSYKDTPDGVLTFTRAQALSYAGLQPYHDRKPHLLLHDKDLPGGRHYNLYREPAERYCPAGVYALREGQLHISAADCLHCKACDIKDPSNNISWRAPSGGSGPCYA